MYKQIHCFLLTKNLKNNNFDFFYLIAKNKLKYGIIYKKPR